MDLGQLARKHGVAETQRVDGDSRVAAARSNSFGQAVNVGEPVDVAARSGRTSTRKKPSADVGVQRWQLDAEPSGSCHRVDELALVDC